MNYKQDLDRLNEEADLSKYDDGEWIAPKINILPRWRFEKDYPHRKCNICGREHPKSEIYRDHDHQTGLIRGWLCSRCNSYVGLHESKKVFKKSARYYRWAKRYTAQILKHLSTETPYIYDEELSRKLWR